MVERLQRIDKYITAYGLYNRDVMPCISWATFGLEYDEHELDEDDRTLFYYVDPPYWRRRRMVRGGDDAFRFQTVEGYVKLRRRWPLWLT